MVGKGINMEREYEVIEITFKSGKTVTYKANEWGNYGYDGKCVVVKNHGAWVGIYNFDSVFSVELH